MAMGTRQSEQASLWVATAELPKSPGHPFYTRLNALLDADDFDRFVEGKCTKFYAPVMGRPSLAPGRYFRLLLVGYFEGIDSERGIAWRATDSLAVRSFLRLPVDEPPPDHSTISRTRRAIDLESHRAVFTWVQQRLVAGGLLKGKTIATDAPTPEANAARRRTAPPGRATAPSSRGCSNGWWRRDCSRARQSPLTPPRSRRTRPCAASCAATPGRAIRSS